MESEFSMSAQTNVWCFPVTPWCLYLFPVPCHDEDGRSVISLRQCLSNVRQAEDWRIRLHWFLQPPGHKLKCELWLRPSQLAIILFIPCCLTLTFPVLFFLKATFPTATNVCFSLIAQRVRSPAAQRQSSDSKSTQNTFLMWQMLLDIILLFVAVLRNAVYLLTRQKLIMCGNIWIIYIHNMFFFHRRSPAFCPFPKSPWMIFQTTKK